MLKKILSILLIAAFIAGTLAILPTETAQAQTAPTQNTYPVIDAIPNPVGVGEQCLLRTGILQALGSVNLGWTGVTITVVKPDNTTTTLGPFKTDSTGVTFTNFVPDQVGTYKLTTNFPNNTVAPPGFYDLERNAFIVPGTVMLASTSETLDLVVQEDPLLSYPGHALPTEYWSRPIDPQLREWFAISGNWVIRPDNSLALYNEDAPQTAHVLWADDLTTGGLTGGLWTGIPASSETGDAYEGKFTNSIAMNGILYYNTWSNGFAGPTEPIEVKAVDLHTNEALWSKEGIQVSFGQILYFNSFNFDGVFTYLWDTATTPGTWTAYDPFDGKWLYNMTNVPSGTQFFGASGEILILQVDFANRWMALWNSTACGQQGQDPNGADWGSWGRIVQQRTLDASNPQSYSWNVSIPAGIETSMSFFTPIIKVYNEDRVMGVFFNQTQVRVWALNINGLTKSSTSTTKLFDERWAAPAEWLTGSNTLHYTGATNEAENGVIAVWSKELRTHYGFSTETGKYLWATESEHYGDAYGWGNAEHTWYFAYGKLYSVGLGGTLYAYDLTNGATSWTYDLRDQYNEPVTGQFWWGWITLIADGKIYIGTAEHSAEQPLPRGAPQVCVNASNGAEIWRVNGMFRNTRWGGNGIIGDSIIATMDTYDQRIYAIGKGPTEVTVDVPGAGLLSGQSVMIRGSVTDISPGTETYALQARFPNGVPAVSDASQSDWMLYVYKQFDRPNNATGVPVDISVIDANGNYRTIGTTTTDSNGQYNFAWIPDIPGTYTVYVTFAGSEAYFGSLAGSAFVVDQPVATATPPQATAGPSMSEQILLPAIAGLFVAIIIVIVLAILILRKRP